MAVDAEAGKGFEDDGRNVVCTLLGLAARLMELLDFKVFGAMGAIEGELDAMMGRRRPRG